ncbi:hypothetical protein EDB82DRAFT_489250 [Fusarium venenatum]|uniref:uncharacterized protein n=1 Tax=Fusarium venenatum TaxID=56646 RepID=UPI001D6F5E20|nr:hypothetical protein EDB82DRAFT_489250 [Fusarium venenatum]
MVLPLWARVQVKSICYRLLVSTKLTNLEVNAKTKICLVRIFKHQRKNSVVTDRE